MYIPHPSFKIPGLSHIQPTQRWGIQSIPILLDGRCLKVLQSVEYELSQSCVDGQFLISNLLSIKRIDSRAYNQEHSGSFAH